MRLCQFPACVNYCEGSTDFCASHNYELRKEAKDAIKLTKQQERKKAQRLAVMKEKRTPIKKASSKRSDQLALYAILRKKFLDKNPLCEICGDVSRAVHHRKGRENDLLLEKKYWMAICNPCHQEIHNSPAWAIANSYSLSRTKTTTP